MTKYLFRLVDKTGKDVFMEGENFGRPTYLWRQTYDGIRAARSALRYAKDLFPNAELKIIRTEAKWKEVK